MIFDWSDGLGLEEIVYLGHPYHIIIWALSASPEKVNVVKHGLEPAFWVVRHGWGEHDTNTFMFIKLISIGLMI